MKRCYGLFLLTAVSFLILSSLSVAYATTGVYMGLGAGYAKLKNAPKPISKHLNAGARAALGYNYDFNSVFGLGAEAGYGYYSASKYEPGNNQATHLMYSTGFDVAAVGRVYFNSHIGMLVKAGAMNEKFIVERKGSTRTTRPEAGVGLAANISKNFAVTLNYMHVFGNNLERDIQKYGKPKHNDVPSIDYVFLGMQFTF